MIGFLLSTAWFGANNTSFLNSSPIPIAIKGSIVQGIPKSNSIQATINKHLLSVVFLENLGEVTLEVTTATGWEVETSAIHTPNGVNFYIPNTGSYIVTFTLPDGDKYYGEFEVTD